jgi:ribosomal protein S18 acetylase RimI-like enzyme
MIRRANEQDIEFLLQHSAHVGRNVMANKIANDEVYLLEVDGATVGWARYNLFWDLVPFLTHIYLFENWRRRGLGTELLGFWENEMIQRGYQLVMTSTQSNEDGQFFYRKRGYKDAGVLLLPGEPGELFLIKELSAGDIA